MIHTTMWTYPWDVIDEGVDRVVGFLKEEVGLDAISLSTVYHTYDELRTHMPGKKLFSGYEDAIYFQPQNELYQGTKIKPHVHPMAKDQDPVRIIAEACRARDLELISWTVPLHNHYMARQRPDCALLGVFGDRYPGCLCPANPRGAGVRTRLELGFGHQLRCADDRVRVPPLHELWHVSATMPRWESNSGRWDRC